MSIEDHIWSDEEVLLAIDQKSEVYIQLDCPGIVITRNDTIALAKHFGLTEEDLKDE